MTNEEIVALIQSGVDERDNLEILYTQNKGIIYKIALRYSQYAEIDDLVQESYFGLLRAVKRYDHMRGAAFITFAAHCITSVLRRYIQKNSVLPLSFGVMECVEKYKKFVTAYETENGHRPNREECIAALEIDEKQYQATISAVHSSKIISLDEPVNDEQSSTYADTIADNYNLENDIADRLHGDNAELWNIVDTLEKNKRDVINLHYRQGQTLTVIAQELNISAQRAGQREAAALSILRKIERIQELAAWCGYDCSLNYRGGVKRFKTKFTSVVEEIVLKRLEQEKVIDNLLAGIDELK